MSFFIRKSLSSGPIRFNFSKGGIGVSAGITGARIGLNKNGAYVAGGRHGLYYRERIGQKKRSRTGFNSGSTDSVELFTDTGQTFTRVSKKEEAPLQKRQDRQLKTYFNAAATLIVVLGIYIFSLWVIGAGIAVYVAGLVTVSSRKHSANQMLKQTEKQLEELGDIKSPLLLFQRILKQRIPSPWKQERDSAVADAAITLYMDSTPEFGIEELNTILETVSESVTEDEVITLKTNAFDELLESCLRDHIISDEEKKLLEAKIKELGLPESALKKQRHLILQLTKLGNIMDDPGNEIECPVNLTRGEKCYFKTRARLLKKKILDTKQRNNVKYKSYGYDIDMEGELYLTNKQIYIKSDNVRNIRLSHILDIVCSLEDDTLHLSLKNRVNPLIIAVPDSVLMSARLNYFIEQQNAS